MKYTTQQTKALELFNLLYVPLYAITEDVQMSKEKSKHGAKEFVRQVMDALEEYDDVTEKHLQKQYPDFYSMQLQNMDGDFRWWKGVLNEIEKL